MGVEVEARQEGVVIEHLLKVGHQPVGVGGVPVETAANLIVDTAAGHLLQGHLHHFQGTLVVTVVVVAEQEFRGHWLRKLGRRAEPAVLVVEIGGNIGIRLVQDINS